ncbi:hypothetical protein QQ045_021076 [Rhodiola kirilowii]
MWHRCLKCAHVDGIPPATRRVIMSDAAWGLSFGKFLELSFSNHATANRVATSLLWLLSKTETLYAEISNVLHSIEHKSTPGRDPSDENELLGHVMELKDIAENSCIITRLYTLDSLINTVTPNSKASLGESFSIELKDRRNEELYRRNRRLESRFKENISVSPNHKEPMTEESLLDQKEGFEETTVDIASVEVPVLASNCNEKKGGQADGQVSKSNPF